ncbi:MAG: hypothetical protein K2Z81_14350 [Cyanobacteria bacterium]|nr:hypothetical protein [Cyanobacteriota bacterium]
MNQNGRDEKECKPNLPGAPRRVTLALILRGFVCRADAAYAFFLLSFVTIWFGTFLNGLQNTVPLNTLIAPICASERGTGRVLYIAVKHRKDFPDWQYLIEYIGNSDFPKRILIHDKANLALPGDTVNLRYCKTVPEIATITGKLPAFLPGYLVIYAFGFIAFTHWFGLLSLIGYSFVGSKGRLRAFKYGQAEDAQASTAIKNRGDGRGIELYTRKYDFVLYGKTHTVEALATTEDALPDSSIVFVEPASPQHAVPFPTICSIGKTVLNQDGSLATKPIGCELFLAIPAIIALALNLTMPFWLVLVPPAEAQTSIEAEWSDPRRQSEFERELLSRASDHAGENKSAIQRADHARVSRVEEFR